MHEKYPLEVDIIDLASTFNNLAVLLMVDAARRDDAKQAHLKALDWLRKLHQDYPTDRHYQAELAGALNSFGLRNLAAEHRAEAEKAFAESLVLSTALTNRAQPRPIKTSASWP